MGFFKFVENWPVEHARKLIMRNYLAKEFSE